MPSLLGAKGGPSPWGDGRGARVASDGGDDNRALSSGRECGRVALDSGGDTRDKEMSRKAPRLLLARSTSSRRCVHTQLHDLSGRPVLISRRPPEKSAEAQRDSFGSHPSVFAPLIPW